MNNSLNLVQEYIYVICRPGGPYWEKLCLRSWVRRPQDQRRQITCLFFGTALKATFVLNFLLKKFCSNLAYVRAFTKNKKCLVCWLSLLESIIIVWLCPKSLHFTLFTTLLRCYNKLETFLQLEISERSSTRGPDGKIRTAGARAISQ